MGLWQTAWGLALAALVQLEGAPPPRPLMEGSSRAAYAIPSDGDTPILQLQTSTCVPVRLLIDTGASRSMVSQALIARLQLTTQPLNGGNFALAGAGSGCGPGRGEAGAPAARVFIITSSSLTNN